jgi:GT2 family glycosyltransferase
MSTWICIPVFNRIEYTVNCLTSLGAQSTKDFTVVICDHGSTDGTSERIRQEFPHVVVINADSSLWWTGAMNRCLEYVLQHAAEDDYLLTLNNDTELPEDYLAQFAVLIQKYPHAVLTSVIHDIGSGQAVTMELRQNWLTAKSLALNFARDHLPNDEDVIEVTHASGRGTAFPLAVFRKLGFYDERHLPHYGADYDMSFKAARADFPIYLCKTCRVFSYVEATGLTTVRNRFSWRSFKDYLTSMKSPANLKMRWWYGWNNCPRLLFPLYIMLDYTRLVGSYFKHFLFKTS